jgi:hypothetical protein
MTSGDIKQNVQVKTFLETVAELRFKYPEEVEFFMKQGEHRALSKAREEKRKQAARPKLWSIIPSGPQDRW